MRNLSLTILLLNLLLFTPRMGNAQSAPSATAPAEISADLGSCSALIAVTGVDAKPVYGAKMTTRVRYGLMGVKKLDLEA
jgi:Ethanolamine utilization protein EutJ (predicted chaperonin)